MEETVTAEVTGKIYLLQKFQDYLAGTGMSDTFIDIVTFILGCLIIFFLIWVLETIGKRILVKFVKAAVKHTHTQWDDFLYQRGFFTQTIRLIAGILVITAIKTIFKGYDRSLLNIADLVFYIYITYTVIQVIGALLNSGNDVYETKPQAKVKSIKGYIQVGKITAYILGAILVISKLVGKEPTDILVALGASAAILSLVFKDTILGVIASIQISAQDMLRPGDWIKMPARNANGVVTDINVSVVKVRNWDNTVIMLPIYLLVSEGFENWRYMQESGKRRIQRPLMLDIKSIKQLTPEMVAEIMENPVVAPLADKVAANMKQWNTSDFSTNIGLYRCYVEAFIRHNPNIAKNTPLTVRYMPVTENGISLEIYAFAKEITFTEYERIVADIFEHIIAVAPIFSIDIYQRPKSS